MMIFILMMFFAQIPDWITYKPVRDPDTNLGSVLSDIDSHMPKGHDYAHEDKITWGHETTHGINSDIRNKYFELGVNKNAFYCLKDRAFIIEEPNIKISRAARCVPLSLRGDVYNWYMVHETQWDDRPLYILDEWVAYTNGSEVRKDLKIQSRSETVQYMMEFSVYSLCVAYVANNFAENYDDAKLKIFIRWNIERTLQIYDGEEGARIYWHKFLEEDDAKNLRNFTRLYLGKEWYDKVIN